MAESRLHSGAGAGLLAALGSVLLLAALAPAGTAWGETPDRPNIIFILADDMGYNDMSRMGQAHFQTPRLDRMAEQGLLFTDHYAGSTVCAPSRAALLTGQHTGRVYQRGNGEIEFRSDPEDITIATRLQDAGYRTAMIGKSGVACLSDNATLPNDKGFDHFFGFLDHRAAHRYYPPELYRNGERIEYPNNHGKEGQTYSGDEILDDALRYLDEQGTSEEPFFLHLAIQQPHADLAVPETYREPYVSRFDETPHPEGQHYRAETHPKATYIGMIRYVDDTVGQVLDKLEALGIEEDTLVIFSSDNGPHSEGGIHPDDLDSTGPLRGWKRDLYEGGIRVPTIAWWPGTIEAGSETAHPSAFWDFAPTALELAGLEVPEEEMDGISYLPTLLGEDDQQQEHEYLYWEFYEQRGKQAVRAGPWKGVRLNVREERYGPIELYNLEEDLGETMDVASEHPDVVERLEGYMDEAHEPSEEFQW